MITSIIAQNNLGKQKDITGRKFGRLTAIRPLYRTEYKEWIWLCKCNCGKQTRSIKSHLLSGHTKSCGCLQKEKASENNKKHGLTKTPFYHIWQNMKRRCLDVKNISWSNYGGRGIKVCKRWMDFMGFKEDMYESYLEHCKKFGGKQTAIDRVANGGNYEKKNTRWATFKEQANNRTDNHLITLNDITKTMKQWSDIYKIDYCTVRNRLKRKWEPLKAFTYSKLK